MSSFLYLVFCSLVVHLLYGWLVMILMGNIANWTGWACALPFFTTLSFTVPLIILFSVGIGVCIGVAKATN